MVKIVLGKFDKLAVAYKKSRPGYSQNLKTILSLFFQGRKNLKVIDLGSGTGIFTKLLTSISKKVIGVEESNEMILNAHKNNKIKYVNQKVESIKLKSKFHIISSASSFHWLDNKKLVNLVNSNLMNGGIFFICYNTRDISNNKYLKKVEKKIFSLNSKFKSRVSSGSSSFVKNKILKFKKLSKLYGPLYLEFIHFETFSKKRYLSVWESSNELRNKLGEKNYQNFIKWIDKSFPNNKITAKYLNKCWILQKEI